MPIIVSEVLGIKLKTPYMLGKHPIIDQDSLWILYIILCVQRPQATSGITPQDYFYCVFWGSLSLVAGIMD